MVNQGKGMMRNTDKNVIRKPVPGIISSRIGAGVFAGGTALMAGSGAFLASPELILPSLLISAGGITGSFFYGVMKTKQHTHYALQKMFGSDVPDKSLNFGKAILGIPFEPQRVLVKQAPYVKRRTLGQIIFPQTTPVIHVYNPELLLSQVELESENYIVCKPGAIYLEQVVKPTALNTWDNAFHAVAARYNLPASRPAGRNPVVDAITESTRRMSHQIELRKQLDALVREINGKPSRRFD